MRKNVQFTILPSNLTMAFLWKFHDAKRPPELCKICNKIFYTWGWHPHPLPRCLKNIRFGSGWLPFVEKINCYNKQGCRFTRRYRGIYSPNKHTWPTKDQWKGEHNIQNIQNILENSSKRLSFVYSGCLPKIPYFWSIFFFFSSFIEGRWHYWT